MGQIKKISCYELSDGRLVKGHQEAKLRQQQIDYSDEFKEFFRKATAETDCQITTEFVEFIAHMDRELYSLFHKYSGVLGLGVVQI